MGSDGPGVALPDAAVSAVIARVYSRRVEIERAILRRVREIVSDSPHLEDPEYVFGLRTAIVSIVEYALMGVERGEEWSGPIPSAAIAQARRAARGRTRLDTVLRRYIAGYALVWDFVMEEAARGPLGHGDSLRRVQMKHASLLDRLIVAITDEYTREVERAGRSPERRRADLVLDLLAGRHVDSAELGYELDAAWHLGVIATGKGAKGAVRALAAALDRELLAVSRGEETVWGWLGGRRRLVGSDIERLSSATWPAEVSFAIGESGRGVDGWLLTHRQAQAALRVVLRRPQTLTRYVDVALLAATLNDEILARSLLEIYLSPLGRRRSDLRATLHAYFAADRSLSGAARSLGVVRQTVDNRLHTAEQAIGRPLQACLPDLEVALRLDELGEP
jgi:PucR C-terminal helix-turn-helix domain/GGDEF-like domain